MALTFDIREYESMEKPVVIAISSYWVRHFNGLQLSGTSATHYYLNPNMPETYHIKQQRVFPSCLSFYLPPGCPPFGSFIMSLEESDDLNIPDVDSIDPVLKSSSLPKFDMYLHKSSLTETHVKWLTKCYGIPTDLHPRVVPEGVTMDALLPDDIGLYAHYFQQGGLRNDKFFLVDRRAAPIAMAWRHHDFSVVDPFPKPSEFDASNVARLREAVIALRKPPPSVTPPNSLQRKTGFGIVTSWREKDLIREIDLYMPIYQCRLRIFCNIEHLRKHC
ncbi:reverse transcriptase domain-containing protein [Tanacetum coccineum]